MQACERHVVLASYESGTVETKKKKKIFIVQTEKEGLLPKISIYEKKICIVYTLYVVS